MNLKVLLLSALLLFGLTNASYSGISAGFMKGMNDARNRNIDDYERKRRYAVEDREAAHQQKVREMELEILRLKLQKVQQGSTSTDSLYNTALQGDAVAQFNLGSRFYNSKNYKEAVKWWRKSARKGLATSQTNLGYMYAHGLGVEKDMFTAKLWTEKGKEQGDAQAQTNWNALELWKY